MPSLGEAYDGTARRRLARVGAGVGLVIGGAAAVALGLLDLVATTGEGLGLTPTLAWRVGLTLTLPVVPGALVALRRWLPAEAGKGPIAAGGAAVGLSVVFVWVAGGPPGALSLAVAASYAVGIGLVLAGVLAGPTAAAEPAGGRRQRVAGFSRTGHGAGQGPMPADGGRDEEADMRFPLDEEE